jgi:hypothetical protein
MNENYDLIALPGGMPGADGVGTAIEFALKLLKLLYDGEKVCEVASSIVFNKI